MNNIEKQASRLFPVLLNGMQNNSYKEFLQSTLIASIAIAYDDKTIMEQAKETNKNIGVFIKENLPTSKYRKVAVRVDRTINNFWSYLNPEYQENSESMLPLLKINILNPNNNFVKYYTVKEAFTSILGIIILNCNYGKLDKLKAEALFNIINNYLISEALKNPKIMKRMKLISPNNLNKQKKKKQYWKWFNQYNIQVKKVIPKNWNGLKLIEEWKIKKHPKTGWQIHWMKFSKNKKWKAGLFYTEEKIYSHYLALTGYCKTFDSALDALMNKMEKL
jgi:hypothetical protein